MKTDVKSRLLAPDSDAFPLNIFGGEFYVRRLTASELADFEEKAEQLTGPGETRGLMLEASALILSALVDKDGVPEQGLPSPVELMKSRSYGSISEALSKVQRFSYGTLEEAKKTDQLPHVDDGLFVGRSPGEYDPRKIANLPANILLHWQAWLSLTSNPIQTPAQEPSDSPAVSVTDQQCADVMRILGQ